MNSLIIENSRRQGPVRMLVQGGLTLFFWCFWIYLMLPLAAPLASLMGLEFPWLASATSTEYLWLIFPILFFAGIVMLGMELWVIYNMFLDRRSKRQEQLGVVYRNELARHFGVGADELENWHCSGQMIIRLTEEGDVSDVEVRKPSVTNLQPASCRAVKDRPESGSGCLDEGALCRLSC